MKQTFCLRLIFILVHDVYLFIIRIFISSFISSYSFSTLFTKINSSWLIFESTKALEIKTSKVFNLVAAELAIPTEIPTKEAKAELETRLATMEAGISKCLI